MLSNLRALLSSMLLIVLCSKLLLAAEQGNSEQNRDNYFCIPLQIALINPVQFVDQSKDICGLRIDLIYGKNPIVTGIDLGLWNISEKMTGIELGLANASNTVKGFQFGLSNAAIESANLVQVGVINGSSEEFNGIQVGVLNDTDSFLLSSNLFSGLRLGLVNAPLLSFAPWGPEDKSFLGNAKMKGVEGGILNSNNQVSGISVGVFNFAAETTGVQLGIVNYSGSLRGLQIGALNIIKSGELPFMPLVNADW